LVEYAVACTTAFTSAAAAVTACAAALTDAAAAVVDVAVAVAVAEIAGVGVGGAGGAAEAFLKVAESGPCGIMMECRLAPVDKDGLG
jgi:hypothetical protein